METTEIRNELYQISNYMTRLLVENVNEESGEIEEEDVFKFLGELDTKKSSLISTAVISYHHYKDLAAHVESKLARLRNIKKEYQQFENTLKNILMKFVEVGEVIETEDFKISWRGSQVVEKDMFLDLEELAESNPTLVRITYELEKSFIKRKFKESGVLPEGVSIVTKNIIQIK